MKELLLDPHLISGWPHLKKQPGVASKIVRLSKILPILVDAHKSVDNRFEASGGSSRFVQGRAAAEIAKNNGGPALLGRCPKGGEGLYLLPRWSHHEEESDSTLKVMKNPRNNLVVSGIFRNFAKRY